VLDVAGVDPPEAVDGVTQQRIDGASLRPTFADPDAPDGRDTQYFEMLGSRSIFHGGWKATTDHISTGVLDEEELAVGSRDFAADHWALFDLRTDFSESTDTSADHPEMVDRLVDLWLAEAGRNQVLPVDDSFVRRIGALVPPAWPAGTVGTVRPGGGPVADESRPLLFGGFRITAAVLPAGDPPAGILCALGDRHGGYALLVDDGRLVFAFSRAGELLELEGDRPVPPGPGTLGVSYVLGAGGGTRDGGQQGELHGTFTLLHGETPVGSLAFTGMLPVALQHGGAGLRLGFDAGLAVSDRYAPPFPWNGELTSVRIETPGTPPGDPTLEVRSLEVRSALHRD
jgi:arylsulfatase